MSELLRLRDNFFSLTLAEGAARVVGGVLHIVLARYLGPEHFGIYALALSVGLVFGLVANLGLDPVIIKELAKEPTRAREYFSHAVLLRAFSGVICFLCVVFIALGPWYEGEVRSAIIVFGLSLFFTSMIGVFDAIFKGLQRMAYSALIVALRPVLNLVLALMVIAMGLGVMWITAVHVVTGMVLFLIIYYFVLNRSFFSFAWPTNFVLLRGLLKSGLPFLLNGGLFIIAAKLDVLMLSVMVGVGAVGLFSSANGLIMMLFILPTIISSVMFPVWSVEYGNSGNRAPGKLKFTVKVLNNVGVPAGVLITFLAPEIIRLLYGEDYAEAVPIFRTLGVAVLLAFSRSVWVWFLTAMGSIYQVMAINIIGVVLNCFLNLLLIPRLGATGAALSTTVMMVVCWLITVFAVRARYGETQFFEAYGRPAAAGVVMAILLVFLGDANLVVRIGGGVVGYIASAAALSMFDQKEWAVIKRSLVVRGS